MRFARAKLREQWGEVPSLEDLFVDEIAVIATQERL